MRTIKEVMALLSRAERDTLMVAFESGDTYYFEWTPGRFLGVGTDATPHLKCEQSAGSFREGTIIAIHSET